MKLEDYAIEARKRTDWEVMDLGTLLYQENLGAILRSSILLGLPILAATCGLVVLLGFFWGYLFLWLMRPLYGRVTLFVLSRAVFASHPTPREIARALPGFVSKGLWGAILVRPWTLSRVLVEPVLLLEGLRGKALRKRSQILLGEGVRGSVWWGAIAVGLVQVSLFMGALALCFGFLPQGTVNLEADQWVSDPSSVLAWVGLLCLALSFAVVEPLWVAVGFAMYLNRRSDLEGWDVELVFRRLAQRASQGIRLSSLALLMVFALLPLAQTGQKDSATVEPTRGQQTTVEERAIEAERPVDIVFATDEFSTTAERWVQSGGVDAPDWLGVLFRISAWSGLAVLVAWILYQAAVWAMGLEAPVPTVEEPGNGGALELAGLDLRRESLPPDVAGEARALWSAGKAREALSLLYRGALVVLRDEHGLFIEDGDTEGRCMRKVFDLQVLELGRYFGGLTDHWMRFAYGEQALLDTDFFGLAQGFAQHFGGRR